MGYINAICYWYQQEYHSGSLQSIENNSHLNLLVSEANVEIDVYEQRAKNLRRLIERRKELISAANENLEELITDINQPNPESITCDF